MNIIKKQRGYTMVLFLAFITAITLSVFSLYDNGIVATERIRIQNTADATAYSTMTVLTRDMNFIAYTNRAMVGNQVAIAQMVGLSSWIHMLDTAADNLNTLAQLTYAFPPVGVWLNQVTSAIQQATSAGKTGIDYFAEYFILATDNLNFVLSKAQDGFQLVTADMALATYNKVAKANDKDIKIGLVGSTLAFGSLIQSWQDEINNNNSTSTKSSNNDELNRYKEFAGVVNDSRDPFSRNRSHDWIKKTTIIEFPGYYTKISLEKKGGSDFIQTSAGNNEVQWQWSSMDTVSFWLHLKWQKWGWSGPKSKYSSTEILPVGWGAGHALNDDASSSTNFNYSSYKNKEQLTYYKDGLHDSSNKKSDNEHWGDGSWKNSISSSFATSYDQNNNLNNTGGLYSFYDLKEDTKEDTKKDTGPSIVAMLTKPTNKLRVQETLDDESNTYNRSDTIAIEEQGSVAGNSLYGLSKAETYFSRPKDLWARADNMREYGNLYNPFWQTRLIDNNATEQNRTEQNRTEQNRQRQRFYKQ